MNLEFEPQFSNPEIRYSDGRVNWDILFEEFISGPMPKREELNLSERGWQNSQAVKNAINSWRHKRWIESLAQEDTPDERLMLLRKTVDEGVDVRNFPELIEPEIRDLCVEINQLPWIKTINSASGLHSQENPQGLEEAYLSFLIDQQDKTAQEFLKRLINLAHNDEEIILEEIKEPTLQKLKTKSLLPLTVALSKKAIDPQTYPSQTQAFFNLIQKTLKESLT